MAEEVKGQWLGTHLRPSSRRSATLDTVWGRLERGPTARQLHRATSLGRAASNAAIFCGIHYRVHL